MAGIIQSTGIENSTIQLPTGRWPDQISYSAQDIYRYSVNPNPKIKALNHVHVINFDLDPDAPYTMSVQLPVMNKLPGKSRFYFFYVSNCHVGDVLGFTPTLLSGDTVNNLAGTFNFVLDGTKTLFICVGVKQNYIIHTFGRSNQSGSLPPLNLFRGSAPDIPSTATTFALPTDFANTINYTVDTWFGPDSADHIPGMDGYIVPVASAALHPVPGFRVVTPGIYRISYCGNGRQLQLDGLLAGPSPYGTVFAYLADGTQLDYIQSPSSTWSFVTGIAPAQVTNFSDSTTVSRTMALPADAFIICCTALAGVDTYSNVGTENSSVSFEYLAPLPPPELELALRSGSSLPAPNPNEIIMGSKQDTPSNRLALHQKQVNAQKESEHRARQLQGSASGQPYSSGFLLGAASPQISLNDLESIIRNVMRGSSVQPSSAAPVPSPSLAPPPPPPSASPRPPRGPPPSAPPPAKRARTAQFEKE